MKELFFVLLGSQVHLKFILAFGILAIRSWKRNKHQDWHLKVKSNYSNLQHKDMTVLSLEVKDVSNGASM